MVLKFVGVTLGLSAFILLLLSPSLALSEISSSSGSTCKIDNECLDYLHNSLLNKESDESIYQFCEVSYQNSRDCCINPSQCGESYAEDLAQSLRSHSLGITRQAGSDLQSCQLNNLSNLIHSLSNVQSGVCHAGVENCKSSCEDKLEKFKQTFRDCFSIQYPHTIDSVLKKAQSLLESPDCYREIRDVAEKYKRQSLNKQSLFEEGIKAKDIVDCESIKKEASQANLNNLALNVCHQAQEQKQQEEERLEERTKQEQVQKASKAQGGLGHEKPAGDKALLGAGAVVGAGTADIQNKSEEQTVKNPSQKEDSEGSKNAKPTAKKTFIKQPQASLSQKAKTPQHPIADIADKTKTDKSNPSISTNKIPSSEKDNSASSIRKQTKSSSEALQLVQAGSSSGNCPISMPQIRTSVVFQSVEAPQIEPMHEQENVPYDNYDLVMGKPGGVLVVLDKANMDIKTRFGLALYIEGDSDYRYNCFHTPFQNSMEKGQENVCYFTESDLSNQGIFKFFPLPMNEEILNQEGEFKISLVLYPWGYSQTPACLKQSDFNINIIKTHNLKLGFTRIDGGKNCTGYDPVSYKKVESFVKSDELKDQIQSMFPVKKVSSKVLEYILNGRDLDYIEGVCDNSPSVDLLKSKYNYDKIYTEGLLSDIDLLEHIRAGNFYDKLFAIVPESYFVFHNIDPPAGIVIAPRWEPTEYEDGFWNLWGLLTPLQLESEGWNLGGSWNVAFVKSDQKDAGTVAHELAHTLGQGRELYKAWEQCRHLKMDQPQQCHENRIIPRTLHTGIEKDKPFWKFIEEDKFTIMDDQSKNWSAMDRQRHLSKEFMGFVKIGLCNTFLEEVT